MVKRSKDERRKMLEEELSILAAKRYISNAEAQHIISQHSKYYKDLDVLDTLLTPATEEKSIELELHSENTEQQTQAAQTIEENVINIPKVSESYPKHKRPIQIKPSKEAQRDRNITWILILGVIMLLISGLFLATNAWDSMNNITKTALILFISILFYGLAFISNRILKIKKTAFAFNILGSLFLPIIILSIGYFELFGNYFSLFGEGKFIFGALGCLVILPIYLYFTYKLNSSIYVWFFFITFSTFAAFTLASFKLPIDWFYLGIMLFSALLILLYYWLRDNAAVEIFIKEFVLYIQTNLILSSLFLLLFFSNDVLHGFNLMITAVLYFSMIYVTERKEFHFVFTALLVYGVYQMIEFSSMQEYGAIGYAILGLFFLFIPHLVSTEGRLKKAFQYTSAIMSSLAFLFITFQAILMRLEYSSLVLFIAYLVIALNFIFLTNVTKRKLFAYLAPVFILVALQEALMLTENFIKFKDMILALFITSFIVYILLGCLNKLRLLKSIQDSTRDVVSVALILLFLAKLTTFEYLHLSIMLFLLSIVALLMHHFEKRLHIKQLPIPSWLHPITLGLSIHTFFLWLVEINSYKVNYVIPFGLILAGLSILALSYLWKKYRLNNFSRHAFFTAQILYILGFLTSLSADFNDLARCFVVFGSIFMTLLLYKYIKWRGLAYFISCFSLVFYLTFLNYLHNAFKLDSNFFIAIELMIGVALLLVTGVILSRLSLTLAKGFYLVAQIALPTFLIVNFLFHFDYAFWPLAFATILYILSYLRSLTMIFRTLFLYAAYTTGFLMFNFYLILLEINDNFHYTFILMGLVIAINWLYSKGAWTKIIALYLIPFSLIGHFVLATTYEIDIYLFFIILIYSAAILYVLYKQSFKLLSCIPLLLNLTAIFSFSNGDLDITFICLLLYAVMLAAGGLLLHSSLYNTKTPTIDWFTITSFLTLLSAQLLSTQFIWQKVLPGLFITCLIVLQRNRTQHLLSKWILFIAAIYILQPYYTLLNNITIPDLFITELYVLPWIGLSIILQGIANKKHHKLTSQVQWGVLIIVALLLIQDGLASNTVGDALILGSLSLVSIVAGFIFKTKSFFFTGSAVLLLNVFIQTRPFWGNMPWWSYLLIAGTVLISVASINEWQKQKHQEGKEIFTRKLYRKIISKLNGWQ